MMAFTRRIEEGEVVKKRTRPLSEAAKKAKKQQRVEGVGASHLRNDASNAAGRASVSTTVEEASASNAVGEHLRAQPPKKQVDLFEKNSARV